MPVKDLVDVRVLCDGKAATQYESPSMVDKDDQVVRYIEVETGARFQVNVTWLAGLRVYPESGLYYAIYRDDATDSTFCYRSFEALDHKSGVLACPEKSTASKTVFKDESTGKYEERSWAFEAIETSQ